MNDHNKIILPYLIECLTPDRRKCYPELEATKWCISKGIYNN